YGARADVSDDFGWTPMHEACRHGNEKAVAMFIKSGINLNFKSSQGETPLHIAAKQNFPGIIARLTAAGADKNAVCSNGNTPLHLAVKNGQTAVVQTLLAAGAKADTFNSEGYAPLHVAARYGRSICADLLLSCVDRTLHDKSGKTFLEIARIFGNDTFVTLMNAKLFSGPASKSLEAAIREPTKQQVHILPEMGTYELPDFFGNDRGNLLKALRGFIFGKPSASHHEYLFGILDAMLWFAVFPLLMFIVWHGFSSGMIPAIIQLKNSAGIVVTGTMLQTGLNWLIIFVISCLLIESEEPGSSSLHFIRNMRNAVLFRVVHYAIIAVYFCRNMLVYTSFWNDFAMAWFWFMVLYTISYYFWWLDHHKANRNQSESVTPECHQSH
ncbi:MAG: ankyrin repeat domain-containing protein, partial [Candidatus Riflebacteria bacterium]|nr:ankyrin repeat domain-containing protein [Candidatus Riflebacteria bacterium]